jgi:hypothetical protein
MLFAPRLCGWAVNLDDDAVNTQKIHVKAYLVVHKKCCFAVMQLYGTRADLQVQFKCWQLSNQARCCCTSVKLPTAGRLKFDTDSNPVA